MDQNIEMPAPVSEGTSCPPLVPLPASVLLEKELARKDGLCKKGNLMTGCKELDDYVLLGGFERGSIVGVSTEEDEVGMLIGLQTIAHMLASPVGSPTARAMVITTLPATVLLPKLRTALVDQLSAILGNGMHSLQSRVRECLERISIARVFDIDGLSEVLAELEDAGTADTQPQQADQGMERRQTLDSIPKEHAAPQRQPRTEILDSEDEGSLSPEPDSLSPEPETPPSRLPDIILITHTSTLLNALFTGRDKQTAHNTILHLSSHLNHLARSPTLGGPLVVLLNSTTSPGFSHHTDDLGATTAHDDTRPPKAPEPTLCSIFNFQSQPQQAGPEGYPSRYPPGQGFNSARPSKPSFGMVFAQMLDLHLLCTRIPRTRADAAALVASPGMAAGGVSCAWVVEVLLDEMGVYERDGLDGGWGSRRSREQRWAAVDVDEGRVVDAVF